MADTPLFSRIDTVILRVRDLAQARAWYATALGLHPVFEDPAEGLIVLGVGGTGSLTLWQLGPGETPPPQDAAGTYPIFAAADAAAERKALEARGVPVGDLAEGPGVRFFGFRDPDGNRLEACQVLAAEPDVAGAEEVTVVIAYQAQPGKAETARRELAELVTTVVAQEPDCREIRLLQDPADPHRLLLVERWTSQEAFTGPHMETPHLQGFMNRAPGFIAGPPEIRFWRVDLVAAAST